jgi:hypothetical protein
MNTHPLKPGAATGLGILDLDIMNISLLSQGSLGVFLFCTNLISNYIKIHRGKKFLQFCSKKKRLAELKTMEDAGGA